MLSQLELLVALGTLVIARLAVNHSNVALEFDAAANNLPANMALRRLIPLDVFRAACRRSSGILGVTLRGNSLKNQPPLIANVWR